MKILTFEELLNWINYLSIDFLGGPKVISMRYLINFQKGSTLFVCLWLMYTYSVTTTGAVYTAIHGSYGIIWVLKDLISPDRRWEQKVTFGSALLSSGVLAGYWIAPWLLISSGFEHSSLLIGYFVFIYSIGIAFMIGSDTQKYFELAHSKGLITHGWFKTTRNPNYFGELLIYISFAYLSGHILPLIFLLFVIFTVWFPGILQKEQSLSTKPGYNIYSSNSGILLPLYRTTPKVVKKIL